MSLSFVAILFLSQLEFEFFHNLSLSFDTIGVLSQIDFLSFVSSLVLEFFSLTTWVSEIFINWIIEICHSLTFRVLSQPIFFLVLSPFELLSFVTIWVFEFFSHYLSCWVVTIFVLSQFEFSSNLGFLVWSQLSFRVLSQFESYSFVTIKFLFLFGKKNVFFSSSSFEWKSFCVKKVFF